jgi:hypothetical protein
LTLAFDGTFSVSGLLIRFSGSAAAGVSGCSDSVAHPKTTNNNKPKEKLFVIGALLDCPDRTFNKQATCPGEMFSKRKKNWTIR